VLRHLDQYVEHPDLVAESNLPLGRHVGRARRVIAAGGLRASAPSPDYGQLDPNLLSRRDGAMSPKAQHRLETALVVLKGERQKNPSPKPHEGTILGRRELHAILGGAAALRTIAAAHQQPEPARPRWRGLIPWPASDPGSLIEV